ncbi:MAG: hypothetical protein JW804_07890 [Sedimentisphaerales bacterium]|nr:hypothetical protein [Sedimentisphaerales bacterium]
MNLQIERLKRLPQHPKETWQGGLIKLPLWVENEDEKPYRPWVGGWISLKTRLIHTTDPCPPQEKSFEMALNSLVNFACDEKLAGYRPAKIEVRDSALAEHLSGLLAEAGIKVEHRNKLFTLDEVIKQMGDDIGGGRDIPGCLDAKGITVELMRSFADAAAEFYNAAPWEYLLSEDLIEVESPFAGASLRFLSVVGSGLGVYGVGFYDSREHFERMLGLTDITDIDYDSHWTVLFGPIEGLPIEDSDIWEDYKLPVAGEFAYPAAVCWRSNGKHSRPGPDILAYMEGLLRALAQSSEDEIDSGRWRKKADTAAGQMEFVLALPELLESGEDTTKKSKPERQIVDFRAMERTQRDIQRILDEYEFENMEEMQAFINENIVGREVPHQEAATPLEKAQDLIYEAFEVRGRKQLQLIRKAQEICPDCADAYVALAERTGDIDKAVELYSKGVSAGEKVLGKDLFKKETGNFWSILETRPYMRARLGLAQCLREAGRTKEAKENYRQLLRLNPSDNQGARHELLTLLIETNADTEAAELLNEYKDDKYLAIWRYTKALLSFREKGDTKIARKYLKEALEVNKYVPMYLVGDEVLPVTMPSSYGLGLEDEAVICSEELMIAWDSTPGAIEWLESNMG